MPAWRAKEGERGAVLVEFALVFPVLLLFLFGIISGGIVYNQRQDITFATREGARYGATLPPTQTFTSGNWSTNVRQVVVDRSEGELTAAQVCVSLVSGSPGVVRSPASTFSTSGSPCIAGQTYPVSSGDDGLRVQITVARPTALDLGPFGSISLTLSSSVTSKSEVLAQ